MSMIEWKQSTYDDTYSQTLASLDRRLADDPAFSLEAARGQLRHLYVQDGNDQGGRGELQDIIMQATIDAYEAHIAARQSAARQSAARR